MTCCNNRKLTWALAGRPRQWAAIFCLSCRHVHRRGVPFHLARIRRDEIESELAKGER